MSRFAASSRAVLSALTRASKSGSRSQRAARGKRGSSDSGTASARFTASSSSPPRCSRIPRGIPLIFASASRVAGCVRAMSSSCSLPSTRNVARSTEPATLSRHGTSSRSTASSRRLRSRAPFILRKPIPGSSSAQRVPSSNENSSRAQLMRPMRSSSADMRSLSSSR